MKSTQPVIPAKAKPRAGIQSGNGWMPDQARHDIYEAVHVFSAASFSLRYFPV